MKSFTTERFRKAFGLLPKHIQHQARKAYRLFQQNPHHPSLQFKQVHPTKPIYSVRITADYRAVGVREGDEIVWFWIGSPADYERLIANL
jgi:mRNA-degrading endonuclease RelE of RelBE toxin-antitoxin system